MTDPAQANAPAPDPAEAIEAQVDAAVAYAAAMCTRPLRASLVANAGFARGRVRRPTKPRGDEVETG